MGGLFTVGGLISGLDSNKLIAQLIAIERGPLLRIERRISVLETQRTAVRELRTLLTELRNQAQDFRFSNVFNAFKSSTSEDTVLTSEISSPNPVTGAFAIDVTQLASATTAVSSGVLGSAIDPAATLDSSGITLTIKAGTITINGVDFTIDPATQSLDDVLSSINASTAGVTATYDAVSDTVTFENTALGDTSLINFGAENEEGDSNLLQVLAVTEATQSTNGSGSTTVTGTRHLGSIDATAVLSGQSLALGAITAGTFSINGISISVDASTDTLQDVIDRINSSDAKVKASYDTSSDTIRFVAETLGSRTVNFGGVSDTSNFLTITKLDTATQSAGNDAQFTINGGATETRNTNSVSDAISGVTINLLSVGASTITVTSDSDSIVENVQEFLTKYNESVNKILELTGRDGDLSGDGGIRSIESFLRSNIFNNVPDVTGDFANLLVIGISSGKNFSSTEPPQLELDEDVFREALRDNRLNVEQLFSNSAQSGIADVLFAFLDEATRTTGYLNNRAKANGSIDQQIRSMNDQIDRMEERLASKEARLRRQFTRLEMFSANLQSQSAALAGLSFLRF